MKKAVIAIPNVFEYASWRMADLPDMTRARFERLADGYADLALFWGEEDKLLVTPRAIPDEFVSYATNLLGYGKVSTVLPEHGSGGLAARLLADTDAMGKLAALWDDYAMVEMRSWGATKMQYQVREHLEAHCGPLVANDLPDREDFWCVDYLDSKVAFRTACAGLSSKASALFPAEGYSCRSLLEAREVCRSIFSKSSRPCVVKSDKGAAGLGNAVLPSQDADEAFADAWDCLVEKLRKSPFFVADGSWVVELLMRGRSPSSWDGRLPRSLFMSGEIGLNGQESVIGGGVDYRDASGVYAGAELGCQTALSSAMNALEDAMGVLGAFLVELGYRGHWGVNFVIDERGHPHAVDLNVRRCGESHAYSVASKVLGPAWMSESYVLSRLPCRVASDSEPRVPDVISSFADVNASNEKHGVVCVPTQVSWLSFRGQRGLGYVIVGPHREAVNSAETELHRALRRAGACPVQHRGL